MNGFVLRGDICHSKTPGEFHCAERAYLVCQNGLSLGVFMELPEKYRELPLKDFGHNLITPGLVDLHVHAPQYASRAAGLELELLGWLSKYTFPCEERFADAAYAASAYSAFVDDLKRGPNTRACVYATVHVPATLLLMELLEESGLACMVGKVSMDRNSTPDLQENSAEAAAAAVLSWLDSCRYKNTTPILTPRFLPVCSDKLMNSLSEIRKSRRLPVQSHLSENMSEIEWVRQLYPGIGSYGEAYLRFDMLDASAVMAHCVWSDDDEIALLHDRGVFVAHCPQSNTNLSSGIAPVRRMLERGVNVGLGSDVAGGCHTSVFRAMSDAIQVSKLHSRLIKNDEPSLTVAEAFYLGTVGGGRFFGKVGCFEPGYEFDAVVFDDTNLLPPHELSVEERVSRLIYLSDDRQVVAKYVRGRAIL